MYLLLRSSTGKLSRKRKDPSKQIGNYNPTPRKSNINTRSAPEKYTNEIFITVQVSVSAAPLDAAPWHIMVIGQRLDRGLSYCQNGKKY